MSDFLTRVLTPFDLNDYINSQDFPERFEKWKSQNGGDKLKASIGDQKRGCALELRFEDHGAIHHDVPCGDVTTPIVPKFESICGHIDLKMKKIEAGLLPYLRDFLEPELKGRRIQFKNVGISAVYVFYRRPFSSIAKPLAIYPVVDGEIQDPLILEED